MIREQPSPTLERRDYVLLAILLPLFFLIAVLTYTHLGEDAFISFRYTRNLARGWGLIYNQGEAVEGYSNLFWVLILTPFEIIGVRLHVAARILSTLFFAGLIFCGLWSARRLVPRNLPVWVAWWLPVALALEPYLHYHDDRGLETVAYAALLGGAMLTIGAGLPLWIAGLLAGLATITRPEGLGFALALVPGVYTLAQMTNGKSLFDKEAIVQTLKFLAWPFGFFFVQLVFRQMTYGELVPNTVIAKKPGGGGLTAVVSLMCSHGFVPLIGLIGLGVGCIYARTRALAIAGLGMWLAAVVFQIRAGNLLNVGFRYQAPILVPSVTGIWLLVTSAAEGLRLDRPTAPKGAVLCGAAMLLFLVPLQISIPGSAYFRGNTDAPRSRLLVRLTEPQTYNIAERLTWYFHDPIFINTQAGLWVRENLPPQAVLAADQMGQFGYHAGPDQTIIDLLGLMDAHIARHGLSVEYIQQRRPAYIVVETCLDTNFWPREWRLQPHVPSLRPIFQLPEFQNTYRPRWLLRPRVSIMQVGYMVYVRSDLDDGAVLEHVPVGPDDAEFEKWWRVRQVGGM